MPEPIPATRTLGGNNWIMEVEERLAELEKKVREILAPIAPKK
jgi:hypothetical protein